MTRQQRIVVPALFAVIVAVWSGISHAQPEAASPIEAIEPVLPPGISDFNLELYGKQAFLWTSKDGGNVAEVLGDFSARMDQYKLTSRDAVVWFRPMKWKDRSYVEVELFLWQDAEVNQPGGTVESGPTLLVTLRTFGTVVVNCDASTNQPDSQSELYQQAMRARRLLEIAPAVKAEQAGGPVAVAPKPEVLALARPKPRRAVSFSADDLSHSRQGEQSVIIAVGEVSVSQGSPSQSGEYLELRADAAVLYLKGERVSDGIPGLMGESEKKPSRDGDRSPGIETPPGETPSQSQPAAPEKERTDAEAASEWVSSVYLEGDVVLTRGQRMIRASRLFYDFDNDRALILDAVMRALEPSRGLPIYVRAEQVRQLSATVYQANRAKITTSEFHTPHMAIGAKEVTLEDRTPKNEQGEVIGVQAGTYKAYHTTLESEGIPFAYWPFSRGDFSRDRQAFKSAKFGYSSDFGATFETQWHLFNLLGLEAPEGFDGTYKLDYFADRGPATGIDLDYEQENYYGLFRGYYINDHGDDDLGGDRGGEPDHENRGRALWRHRQFLPKDWELTLEGAYVSDDQYLESFERNEFENGKDQETAIYLVKREENRQFNILANWRINEFMTQTEHLPEAQFNLIGEPLGDFATLYSDTRAGIVRYRYDERRWDNGQEQSDNTGSTGAVLRGDTREELRFPLPELGPVKFTPYVAGRASGWDDSPQTYGGGGKDREFGSYGLHANSIFSRVYDDVESDILDVHRLRHVVKVDGTLFNAHANQSPMKLTPFDSGVEDIDDFGGGTMGVRQKWQTKRGGPGRERTVDWIVLDVEGGFFRNSSPNENTHGDFIYSRPEDSISSNFIATNFQYRVSDSTVLVYDGVYDTNRGNMGNSNVGIAVERDPRLSYFAGWRYIHDTDNNLLAFGANYKLNEKHTIAFRELYDIERGRNYSTEIAYIRRWPRWYTAVAFDVDRALDDVGITLSIWPEGAENLGIGSKRYTGLAEDIGMNLR